LERDLAWQAAVGLDAGAESFHPTTLVGLRKRLRASGRPPRLFTDTEAAAGEAGVMGNRVRVLDSTPIYDSVRSPVDHGHRFRLKPDGWVVVHE